jgi:hypothetical protein
MKNLMTLILLFSFPLSVNAYIPDTASTFFSQRLAAGSLLIASKNLKGGIFGQSVILVMHDGQDGAIGLILNRPSRLNVNDVVSGLVIDSKARRLFVGGPVKQAILSVLVKAKKGVGRLKKIMPHVYYDFGVNIENASKYISFDTRGGVRVNSKPKSIGVIGMY